MKLKRIILICLSLILLISLVGCNAGNSADDFSFSYEKPNNESINRGDTLVITIGLTANKTYSWRGSGGEFNAYAHLVCGEGENAYKIYADPITLTTEVGNYKVEKGESRSTTQYFMIPDNAPDGTYSLYVSFGKSHETYDNVFTLMGADGKSELPIPGGTDVHEAFDIRISWANWLGSEVFEGCLNFDKLAISSVHHVPLHRFSSRSELDAFKARFGEDNSFDYGYDGKSFNENTADYDEAFFAENDLFLVYVDANSGSLKFDVNSIFNDGNCFSMYVHQTNNPEHVTDDRAGWFITIAVPKSATESCTTFDAIFGIPQ